MHQLSDLELDIQTKLLRATFLNNMAVMNKHMPEIFNFFQNYQQARVKLTFDQNGDINMVSNGSLVYEEKAKENSYKQAEAFFEEPRLFSYQLNKKGKTHWKHVRDLNKIYERRENQVGQPQFNLLEHEKSIDLITMIGVGLGYHIERLFELCDIRYFYLFEPDPDCFYCAMHCIDFGPLIERCFSLGGAFTIKLGGNANQFVNGVYDLFTTHGVFNVARFFNYRHYRSEMTDEATKNLYELAYRYSSGWGFCEDEVISITHTLGNAQNKYPYLMSVDNFDNPFADKPVFVLGNGPSLDDSLEFLKENQENAVVFSCGTALKPILDAGITPDFHIEMERTAELFRWVDSIGYKEKLKQLNVLALNPVCPKVLGLFKKAYLLSKPKDGGVDFIYEFLNIEKYPEVYACNPTVTNAATAAAVYLGFKNLYLFGVDYGWIDDEHHHSKGSIYYQKDSVAKDVTMIADMKIPGNFVEEVSTTQHFDNSRASLEILLENNPDVTCYNCSNGANVQLTVPTRQEEIEGLDVLSNKTEFIGELLQSAFSFEELEKLNLTKKFKKKLPLFKTCIDQLVSITNQPIQSRRQLAQVFTTQYKHLLTFSHKKETKVIYRFLNGSLNYFQSNIMTNAYLYEDEKQQLDYIKYALNIFNSHFLWLYEEIENGYNKPAKR